MWIFSRTYVSQFPDLATETSDLVIQIAVHRINPQLDFIGISHWSSDKTFPACNSLKMNHTLTNGIQIGHCLSPKNKIRHCLLKIKVTNTKCKKKE